MMNNTQMISMFKEGMHVNYFGRDAVIEAIKTTFAVLVYENNTTSTLDPKQLNHAYQLGKLIIKKRKNAVVFQGLTLEEDKLAAEILRPFLDELHRQTHTKSLKTALKVIDKICKKHKISPDNAPCATTLIAKYKVYLANNLDIVPVIKKPIKARALRLNKAALKITEKCIYDLFLQPNGVKASEVYREIVLRCDIAGLSDKCLSQSQFYNFINKLNTLEVVRSRQGHDAARRIARESGGKYTLDFPLQRVEIDAVHIKVGLMNDATLEFIGVPILYLAIDTYTRCIIGYSISWGESPGELASAVTELIKRCVSPKIKSPKAMNGYPLTGIPYVFFGDAGAAFIAREVECLTAQLECHYSTTETKSPWKKPFIESFNKTLRSQFCDSLPGYMRNDGENNYDETIEAMAVLTMTEFIDALDVFILDHYHQNPHSGLYGDTPANYCKEALENFTTRQVTDMNILKVIKGSEEERAVQPSKGIQMNNVFYSSRQLTALRLELLRSLKAASPKVTFFYDKNDISKIVVINNEDGSMFQVETKDPRVKPGMSLKEFKSGLPTDIKSNKSTPFNRFNPVMTDAIERKARALRKKREEAEQRKSKSKARQKAELNAQDEAPTSHSEHIEKEKSRYAQNHTDKTLVNDAQSDEDVQYPDGEWKTE